MGHKKKENKDNTNFWRDTILLLIFGGILSVFVLTYRKESEATLLFVGDMNFDRYVREVTLEKGGDFIFSCIGDTLKAADLVIGNLEGPITDNKSVSVNTEVGSPANYIFTFPNTTADLIKKYNISLVNMGNNHANDFGRKGVLSTRKYLDEAEVNYFGGLAGDEPIYRTNLGGNKVSFVSYNQFGGVAPERVAEKIREESQSGNLVIVYTHWGEEYSPVTNHQRRAAKLFSEAGAKAIIGSHPHVISASEKIGDTFVYYSLGNFIFDQYWNPEVRTGLMLELTIKGDELSVLEHKVSMERDGRTCLVANQN